MFAPPVIQELSGGRLHLSHGPIDVVLKAFGAPRAVADAHAAAVGRFGDILGELCGELELLRAPLGGAAAPQSPVGRRMAAACAPFADRFVTPMAAVAGSVADELLETMLQAAPLDRAFVNDGGDIALFCAPGEELAIGVAGDFSRAAAPRCNGALRVRHGEGVGGVATSGARGRSLSFGIADSVTVLAADAATADVAATLVANALNCDDPAIERRPARDLDPDSDLGDLPVTVAVGPLTPEAVTAALDAGLDAARDFARRGLILDAALMLAGRACGLDLSDRAVAERTPG